MLNYWFRQFILPKKIIKRVQQISAFLWKGDTGKTRGARVSWDDTCYPKKEGGLGLKNLEKWNRLGCSEKSMANLDKWEIVLGCMGLKTSTQRDQPLGS